MSLVDIRNGWKKNHKKKNEKGYSNALVSKERNNMFHVDIRNGVTKVTEEIGKIPPLKVIGSTEIQGQLLWSGAPVTNNKHKHINLVKITSRLFHNATMNVIQPLRISFTRNRHYSGAVSLIFDSPTLTLA